MAFRSKPKSARSQPMDISAILNDVNSVMTGDFDAAGEDDGGIIDPELERELLALEMGGEPSGKRTRPSSKPQAPKSDQRSSDSRKSSGARSGAGIPSAGASKTGVVGNSLDFASVLADVNSLMNNEPISNEDFDNDDDSEYDDELKALMGGDDSTGQSDNEEYYETLNSHRGGTQSADTSPIKQPHPQSHSQAYRPPPANQQTTALQEMLKNKPVPHYGNQQQVIEERLTMYNAALLKSQMSSDQSKVRRYTRQIKTLEDQRKMIKAGKLVKDEDIPGPITMVVPQSASAENNQATLAGTGGTDDVNNVSAGTTRTVPSSASGSEHSPTADMLQAASNNPAPGTNSSLDQSNPQGTSIKRNQDYSGNPQLDGTAGEGVGMGITSSESTLSMLNRRVHEYKVAAQLANKQGDKPSALNYVRVIKGFQEVIAAVESGKQVDVSNLPGPPPISNGPNSATIVSLSGQQMSADNSSIGSNNSDNFNSPAHQPGVQQQQMSKPNITPSHHSSLHQQQANLSTAPSSSSTSSANNVPCSPIPHNQPPEQRGQVPLSQTGGDENLEALIVRMNVYKETSERAKQQGDSSKARRQERLKNQYMDAIRAYKANRPVAWDNLVNPYGYPPLPNTAAAAAEASAISSSGGGPGSALGGPGGASNDYDPIASLLNAAVEQIQGTSAASPETADSGFGQQGEIVSSEAQQPVSIKADTQQHHAHSDVPANSSAPSSTVAPSGVPTSASKPSTRPPPPVPPNHPSTAGGKQHAAAGTLPNKIQMTVDFLEKRQQQYRAAAIASKKRNEIEEAKRYLRLCKGFDPMIAAAKLGKPVDLAQVPPALTGISKVATGGGASTAGAGGGGTGALIIPVEQPCAPKHNADPKEVASLFQSIEQQLQLQINKCRYDSEYYAGIGEIGNVNRAEKMLQCSMVDLNVVQACRLRGELPPKMHYEQRAFTKIRVNSDLNEGECEVLISRAINLPCPDGVKPNDMSTYAKWSFPWPSESSTSGQTGLVKNSDKPVFNFKQKIPISDRKERMSRQVKRKTLDVTVYAKGGIFKSDKALGIALVKLDALDKKCTLHEVVQLMDPVHTRSKATCGKVEVSVRIREPFVCKDTEEVVEKWLVVDAEPTAPIQPQSTTPSSKPLPSQPSSSSAPTDKSNVEQQQQQQQQQPSSSSAGTSKGAPSNSAELKPPGDESPLKSPKTRKKSPKPPPRNPPPSSTAATSSEKL